MARRAITQIRRRRMLQSSAFRFVAAAKQRGISAIVHPAAAPIGLQQSGCYQQITAEIPGAVSAAKLCVGSVIARGRRRRCA